MGVRIRVALLGLAMTPACSMTSEHPGQYRCDDEHRCPGGQSCRQGLCELGGPIDAEPAQGSYEGAVMEDAPAGYWRLDELEGSTAVDRSGNGHDGT